MPQATRPRANADPAHLAAKRARLSEPHVAPLTAFVRQIRAETGGEVPDFDPDLGGVRARALLLLESPGRLGTSAVSRGSGLISPDNNDHTAALSWQLYREAGLAFDLIVSWNIVPWYLGTDRRNRPPEHTEVESALPYLRGLLELLPDLRVVLTVGKAAQAGWQQYRLTGARHLPPALPCPHPSPRNVNTRPAMRGQILAALQRAQAIIAPPDAS
jgi:hypothetical protein